MRHFLQRLFFICIFLSVCNVASTYDDNFYPFIQMPPWISSSQVFTYPTIEFEQGFTDIQPSEVMTIVDTNLLLTEESKSEELNKEGFDQAIETVNLPFLLYNAENFLDTPTYDGSGQAMHPDIVYFPQGWNGYKYWMAMTPYPGSRRSYESPSILASNDGCSWEVPDGLINPIISPILHKGNNADPDMVYNPDTDEFLLYYICFKDRRSYLYRTSSKDGINWLPEELIFSEPGFQILSPSVVYKDGIYQLWYVDAGSKGINSSSTIVKYRTSSDGIVWSDAQVVDIEQFGCSIWHLDVIYVPTYDEYWMLFPAYFNNTKANRTLLFFARAKDSVTWSTFSEPVLGKGTRENWDSTRIYRASFIYDNSDNKIRVWYSAAKKRYWPIPTIYDWFTGYTETYYAPNGLLTKLVASDALMDPE